MSKILLRPSTVTAILNRLVRYGCGHPAYCHCLLCRIKQIAETEKDRTKSGEPLFRESPSKSTRIIDWRGGFTEFAKDRYMYISDPPWYVIKISGDMWSNAWYWWLDYAGPPQVFLTRKSAHQKAKELKKQYGCRAEVIKIEP